LTGSFFLLEKIDNPGPAPFYDYDETGVVLKGKQLFSLKAVGHDVNLCLFPLQASCTLRTRRETRRSSRRATLSSSTAGAPSSSPRPGMPWLTRWGLVTGCIEFWMRTGMGWE